MSDQSYRVHDMLKARDASTRQRQFLIRVCVLYRKTSSISRTKFQNLNVSCILLQLSSLNPLKPGVKLRMKM